ncbi:hypothetical protein TTHERM_00095460 (macronuclear) [Tetrahymena thermophila SB210]|uniref:Uncharacterized protein n=1 Tax=Tetrahymena thermophila (strain SB210) TaxID=312017 RepID=Q235A3_TETTS|nr:hypothetical protein TTHERM_00095460 [Tetrahymena thermophila SB210]EAR91850.1 hypothetical protein TTHERM_00095460 [Tetrahymena thermophila SB210]|eukprot:XP_001012095.1 hypothetical protein TTHERM_00095460 [Tetrahymena thermophila SB210]
MKKEISKKNSKKNLTRFIEDLLNVFDKFWIIFLKSSFRTTISLEEGNHFLAQALDFQLISLLLEQISFSLIDATGQQTQLSLIAFHRFYLYFQAHFLEANDQRI